MKRSLALGWLHTHQYAHCHKGRYVWRCNSVCVTLSDGPLVSRLRGSM